MSRSPTGASWQRVVLATLLVAYILLLLDLTLLQFPVSNPASNLIPFHSIAHDWRVGGRDFVVNFLGNIVAFLPLGLLPPLIRLRRTSARHVVLFSLAISLLIEVGQSLSRRRVADVDDLLLNVLGALIGYSALVALRRLASGPARPA
jgi:glycopeptide antibiotics resistance protein